MVISKGGVNQSNAFHANGNPMRIPDKWPMRLDCGMINLVMNNKTRGPKLTGSLEQFTGQITAEYMLSEDGLFLHKVTHNGVLLPGQIRLHEGKCA